MDLDWRCRTLCLCLWSPVSTSLFLCFRFRDLWLLVWRRLLPLFERCRRPSWCFRRRLSCRPWWMGMEYEYRQFWEGGLMYSNRTKDNCCTQNLRGTSSMTGRRVEAAPRSRKATRRCSRPVFIDRLGGQRHQPSNLQIFRRLYLNQGKATMAFADEG